MAQGARVTLGGARAAVGTVPTLEVEPSNGHKRVSDMGEAEKRNLRESVLDNVRERVAAGKKDKIEITVDWEDLKGAILMRRPSIEDDRKIGVLRRAYANGFSDLDTKTDNICWMLATFDVIVEEAPEWFKPKTMHDYRLLEWIWGRWAAWRLSFREFRPPESEGIGESSDITEALVDSK